MNQPFSGFPKPTWSSSLLRDAPIDYPAVDPTDAPTDDCPDGWFNAANLGCFYFANSRPDRYLTWVEAMDVCENMGGYLAEIQTQEQADFIVRIKICQYFDNYSPISRQALQP